MTNTVVTLATNARFCRRAAQAAARNLIDTHFDAVRAMTPNGDGNPDAAWQALMRDIFVLATHDYDGDREAAKGALSSALNNVLQDSD